MDRPTEVVLAVLVVLTLVSAVPVHGGDAGEGPAVGVACTQLVVPSPTSVDGSGQFTENLGQWDECIAFRAVTPSGTSAFTADGVRHHIKVDERPTVVRVDFAEGATASPMGVGDLGHPTNYLIGSDPEGWVTGARSYRQLVYEEVWPGIDVRYRFSGADLKYDVIVGPDADPSVARFEVDGCEGLRVVGDRLDILLQGGSALQDRDLEAFYSDGEPVEVAFRTRDGTYGFTVDKEPGRELVIDPLILPRSTLLGGSYDDLSSEVELDDEGNVYVAGTTLSHDFPVTAGAFSEDYANDDIIVTKLDRDLSEVLWATFIGGSGEELLTGLKLDGEGDLHLLGETRSADFPLTDGALQRTHGNIYSWDIYVLKLSSDGSALDYSTLLGGFYDESAGDIEVHDGRTYVAAMTESPDFPIGNISATIYKGVPFVMVLDTDGDRVEHLMHWPVTRSTEPFSMHVDSGGNVTVCGRTGAYDLPVTPGAYMTDTTGFANGFVIKCDPVSNVTLFSTYFARMYAHPTEVALDGDGYVYLAGISMNLTTPGLEVTEGAYCDTYKGRTDAFIAKMDPLGTELVYCTLMGGDGDDVPSDLEVTREGWAVAVGYMRDGHGHKVSERCLDPVSGGVTEGFVFALSEDGSEMVHSTFLGGRFQDVVSDVDITENDTLLLTGHTDSKAFPVTEGSYQEDHAGNLDVFVTELACLYPPGAPRNLDATGGDGSIRVTWKPPLDDGGYAVSHYQVLRGTEEWNLTEHEVVGDVTSYLDPDVEYGVRYFYAVQAFNGRGLGPRSNVDWARSLTVPGPPEDLSADVRLDHVWLSWMRPSFVGGDLLEGYRLYRAEGEGPMERLADINSTFMSYTDAQIDDGTRYTYQLSAVNSIGESAGRASVSVRTRAVPTPPRDLGFTYGDRFINLTWEPPECDFGLEVFWYHVYRLNGTQPAERVGVVSAPAQHHLDRHASVGVPYTYFVTAENLKGESGPSETIEAMTRVRPYPPEGVAVATEERFVRVTWEPPGFDGASPVTGYRVYLGANATDGVLLGGVDVEGVANPVLVFLHEIAYDGVVRHFFVTALNAEGESPPSPVASTETFPVPSPPRGLEVEWGDGALTLQWMPPLDDGGNPVRQFLLYRRVGPDDEWTVAAELPAGNMRHVDDGLENGVKYSYRVTASNLAGEGEPSVPASAVPAGPPDAPTSVSAEGLDCSVRLTWEPPAWTGGRNVSGYRVYGVSGELKLELLAELGAGVLEHTLDGLVNGETYNYAIRALTEAGGSDLSVIVEGAPVGPPGVVPGPFASWLVDHVHLTWSVPVSDGGSPVLVYMVRRDDWDAGNWTEVTPLELAFRDYDAEHGRTYNYTVHAVNAEGSGPAARVTITVPEATDEATGSDDDYVDWPYVMAAGLALALAALALANLRFRRK